MKFIIKTYGCQMNERDSDMVGALLRTAGYEPAEREAEADVVIVNTCSVRRKAEEKALGKLGLLVASRRRRPGKIIGAMGCMVQRMGVDILRRVNGLDFAVGTHRFAAVPSVIEAVLNGQGPIVDAAETGSMPQAIMKARGMSGVSAFINILFGCDRRCSYCIVPRVRGPEWSRPLEDIVEEAEDLARAGVREIVLLGQSVMSYGRKGGIGDAKRPSRMGFTEPLPVLLEMLSELNGVERIRFTSAHPSGCTEELARAIAELPPVCEHVHLPLQSGSDRILKLMNRGYSKDDFKAAIARLRSAVPELGVTTDVIVGFPTETDADFEATRAFMDEIMFDNAFIFKYNARPGTDSAEWADDVAEDEKLRRNHVLLEDQDRRGLALNNALAGKDVEVLVEGASKRNKARCSGRTRTNKIVIFNASPHPAPGELITVCVERAGAQTLFGKMKTCLSCP